MGLKISCGGSVYKHCVENGGISFLFFIFLNLLLVSPVSTGLAMEKEGRSSAMSEGDVLDEDEDDEDEEGGAETEEQSGNESEINEPEEDVSL